MLETTHHRTQSVVMSNLNRSDGSALYAFGDTVIQTSVFGPTEVHQSKEDPMNATVEVIYRRPVRNPSRENPDIKLIERFLLSNLTTIMYRRVHPRTQVTILLQELQNSGSLLASCLNSVCFALLDSGFPIKYLLAAVSAVITSEGHVIVNATNEDVESAVALFTIVFESVTNKMVSTKSDGTFTLTQLQTVINLCGQTSTQIFDFYRKSIEKRFEKDVNNGFK